MGNLQDENLAVYLYNVQDNNKQFLGGAIYTLSMINATSISFLPEIEYASTLKSQYDEKYFHEETIPTASGNWQVCLVPIDDTFYSSTSMVIFGGVMIFLISVGIAVWMDTNMKRIVGIYKAKVQAEAERAIVECICPTHEELRRFRQLVVQMSTDSMDQEIGKLQKERWNKAFSGGSDNNVVQDRNRKATIVIEHLIQASDVLHTMQHWHIYRKWNQNLFFELYHACKQGQLEKDPSLDWYKGELGFFDFYVIPLAKKLDTCGVFGVTSDEFLMYAMANRKEWEMKGEQLVQDYLEVYNKEGALGPAARLYKRSSDISQGEYHPRMSEISDDLESRSSISNRKWFIACRNGIGFM